jgi:hypothetical protein
MLEGLLSAQQHRYLKLGDHVRTLYMDYHPRAEVTVESLVGYTPFLECLKLFSTNGYDVPEPMDLVWRSCPRLVEVYCEDVLLDSLTSLARYCPDIQQLDFRRLLGVSDYFFQPLLTLKNLTMLSIVDFDQINSYQITSTICQLHQLEHLEVITHDRSKNDFGELLHRANHRKTLSNLKIIRLGGDGKYYAKQVIDFLATHPLVETIDAHMVEIDNNLFSSVAGHPNLCIMRLLSGAVIGLEGESVRSMVISCPQLTTLWLPQGCGLPDRYLPEAAHLNDAGFFWLDSLTMDSIRQNSGLHFTDNDDEGQAIDKT